MTGEIMDVGGQRYMRISAVNLKLSKNTKSS